RFDLLQERDVALEEFELARSLADHSLYHFGQELFRQHHVFGELHEGHLGLDHPELREMSPRLALLRPKRGSEAIDFPERSGSCLHVELPGLREERRLTVKVGFEQRAGALARVRREDW